MTVCSQFPFDYIYSGKNDIMPTLVQAKPCIVFKKLKMKILDGCQPSQKCILHSNETWVILMMMICSVRWYVFFVPYVRYGIGRACMSIKTSS